MAENERVWEVFIQSKNGLAHKHVGNVHASDKVMALENARELYTRRNEGINIRFKRKSWRIIK